MFNKQAIKIIVIIAIFLLVCVGVFFISKSIVYHTSTKDALRTVVELPTEKEISRVDIVNNTSLKDVKDYWGSKISIESDKDVIYDVASKYSVMLLSCNESPYKEIGDSYDIYEKDSSIVVAIDCGSYGKIEVMCSTYSGVPMGFVRNGSFSDDELDFISLYLGNKAIVKKLDGDVYGAW